jgi:flagellar hook-associated protein 2
MNPLYGHSSLYPAYGSVYSALGQRLSTDTPAYPQVSSSTATDAYQLDLSAYGQLLSYLNSFQSAMAQLGSGSQSRIIHASSSDSRVATASASNGAQAANYTLTVRQLAQSQTLASSAFSDASNTVIGSGSLSIETGSYLPGSHLFTADGSGSIKVNISNGTLDSIAAAINSSGANVIAGVVQNSDGYHLTITRKASGLLQNMRISVTDADGSNTDQSGLSQLAYDPAATSGSGKNLTQTQAGQNAAYSVNGVSASSPVNTGVPLASGVYASLLASGSSSIAVGTSYAQLHGSAQTLAGAFNTLQQSVSTLVSGSSALQNDSRVTQLLTAMDQVAMDSRRNGNSMLTSLPDIGIRLQKAQTNSQASSLSVDQATLQQAYALDQGGAANLLMQSASDFDHQAQNYSSPGSGILAKTIEQMRQWEQALGSPDVTDSKRPATPYSMATMLAQNSSIPQKTQQLLSAQQSTAISQYSMILAMSQPVAINTLQNHQISQIPWLDNGNDISVFA